MRPKKDRLMERLLRIEDVAEWLGVKPSTVYSWLQRGRGPPVVKLPSGAVRFRREAVEAWVKKCERVGWRSRADAERSHGQTCQRTPKVDRDGSGAP
jgi:excisionase family DNA binding protein